MNADDYILDPMPDLGVQGDGEPAAVETDEPKEPVEVEPAEPAESEGEEETPKKKPGSQRLKERVQRLTDEAEHWKRLALENQKKPEPEAKAVDASAPRQEDFEDYAEWIKASIRHEAEKLIAEREAKANAQKFEHSWEEKKAAARAEIEDFDDALEGAAPPSPHVAQVLVDSPIGAKLAYHLATHEDEYRRINMLGPVQAARELGLLEAKLTTPKPEPKTVEKTKAPKPAAPVSAPSAPKPTGDDRLVLY